MTKHIRSADFFIREKMNNGDLHRQYLKHGLSGFEDTEVLELLLSLQLDSVNHEYEAREFLHKYGNLSNIIDFATDQSGNGSPLQEEYRLGLRLPHDLANRYLSDQLMQGQPLNSPSAVVDYLTHSMRGRKVEHFKVLYLNGRNSLIHDEDISKGTVGHTSVYPREVMRSALECQASGLIFAHNHNSGDPQPSEDDIEMTKKLRDAANLFEMTVHDHIIIGGNGYFSFQERGLIKKI